MWILLIILGLPILEIALFIVVGGLIGLWPTLGLVILSAIVGVTVMRVQGMQTLARLRAAAAASEDPSAPLANGALVLVAGILLVIPGFFTDAVGLLLLIPPLRAALIRRAGARMVARSVTFGRGQARSTPGRPTRSETIETDYEVLDDVPPSERGASGWTRPQS